MSTELHRFGIDNDDSPPDSRFKKGVIRLLTALVTNPHLMVGDRNTEVVFPQTTSAKSGPSETTYSSSIAFCTLYQDDALDWFITGGPVHAGIKNFSVPDFEVATGVDDEWVVFITVNVEAYRDDDGDYFLSGIKTSSDATLAMEKSTDANYPDNTDPPVSSGLGIIKLPVGRLRVVDEIPSFSPTACGGFSVAQCGGSLTYRRI